MNLKAQHIICNAALSFFTSLAGLTMADGIPEQTKLIAALWVAFITAALAAVTTWKEQLPPKNKTATAVMTVAAMALPYSVNAR